jgi:hypothetical protein
MDDSLEAQTSLTSPRERVIAAQAPHGYHLHLVV